MVIQQNGDVGCVDGDKTGGNPKKEEGWTVRVVLELRQFHRKETDKAECFPLDCSDDKSSGRILGHQETDYLCVFGCFWDLWLTRADDSGNATAAGWYHVTPSRRHSPSRRCLRDKNFRSGCRQRWRPVSCGLPEVRECVRAHTRLKKMSSNEEGVEFLFLRPAILLLALTTVFEIFFKLLIIFKKRHFFSFSNTSQLSFFSEVFLSIFFCFFFYYLWPSFCSPTLLFSCPFLFIHFPFFSRSPVSYTCIWIFYLLTPTINHLCPRLCFLSVLHIIHVIRVDRN